VQRVVKGHSATLTLPVDVKVTSGVVTITRDRDATTLVNAASVNVDAADVTYALAAQPSEAVLTAVWTLTTASGTNTVTEKIDVCSCETVTLDELRRRKPLDNVNRYPDYLLRNVRAQLEDELSDRAGVKFAGGEFTVTLDGNNKTDLFLSVGQPRSITSITMNDTAMTADQLALVKVDTRKGVLYYPNRWTSGRLNVTVTGIAGFTQPVGGLPSAMSKGVRYMVVDSPVQDRAISVSNEDGTTQNMMVAGLRGAIFAIPELNMLVESSRSTFGIS
jgi:hypothetical protein